jgi:hypothetical protein
LKLNRRFLGTDINPEAVRVTGGRLREFGEGREPVGPSAVAPNLLELMR